jgi:hypothetical protein
MPVDRSSIEALKNLIEETDLILSTTDPLPENRTSVCRENLRAALALTDDLLKQSRTANAAAIMGRKSAAKRKLSPEFFRELAAKRKNNRGGRPRKAQ